MKSCRLLVVSAIILAALLACNLPTAQHPGTSVEPATATPLVPTLSPTLRPPTSTPAPQVWFIDVQDGQVLTAELHPDSHLPMVSLQIGFAPDNSGIASYFVLDADGMQVARVQNTFLDQAASTTFNWTAWHGNGTYRLDLYKIAYGGRILSQQTINISVTGIPDDVPTVAQRFQAAYLQYFGLHLTAPVFAHYMVENPELSNKNRWISTAYIGDTFYKILIFDEIDSTQWFWRPMVSMVPGSGSVCRPVGDYKILLMVVDYGNTAIDHEKVLEKLAASEAVANQRWSDYSTSLGLAAPVMHIETTQAYLEAPPSPGKLLTVEQVKSLTGYDPADFDILVEVDLDLNFDLNMMFPNNSYVYDPRGVALMGACQPGGTREVNIIVGIDQPKNVNAGIDLVYDHELVHLFGWEHEWPDRDGSGPAQYNQLHCFPYTLLGWTDTDGDGVIEILSAHPYGLLP